MTFAQYLALKWGIPEYETERELEFMRQIAKLAANPDALNGFVGWANRRAMLYLAVISDSEQVRERQVGRALEVRSLPDTLRDYARELDQLRAQYRRDYGDAE